MLYICSYIRKCNISKVFVSLDIWNNYLLIWFFVRYVWIKFVGVLLGNFLEDWKKYKYIIKWSLYMYIIVLYCIKVKIKVIYVIDFYFIYFVIVF